MCHFSGLQDETSIGLAFNRNKNHPGNRNGQFRAVRTWPHRFRVVWNEHLLRLPFHTFPFPRIHRPHFTSNKCGALEPAIQADDAQLGAGVETGRSSVIDHWVTPAPYRPTKSKLMNKGVAGAT